MTVYPQRNKRQIYTGRWVVLVVRGGHRLLTVTADVKDAYRVETKLLDGATLVQAKSRLTLLEAPELPKEHEEPAVYTLAHLGSDALLRLSDHKDGGQTADHLATMVRLIGPDRDVRPVRHADFERAAVTLRQSGKGLKTVNRYLAAMSGAMRWAWKNDRIDRIPPIPWAKEGKGRIAFVPEHVDAKVVGWLTDNGWREHALIYQVLVTTGLRIAELTTLAPSQVEAEWLRLVDTKNRDSRSVPIASRLSEPLRALLSAGTMPCYDTIYKSFVRATKALGLEFRITPHILRHSTATRLTSKGVPTAIVKAFLGHKSLATTLQYAHAEGRALQDAAKLLQAPEVPGGKSTGNLDPLGESERPALIRHRRARMPKSPKQKL